MADYISNIEDMYKKLYASKEQQALQKKNQNIADIEAQQSGLNNQYIELQNALKARRQQTQAQYQGLYTNLDNQAQEVQERYYQDRNNAAVNNVQRAQAIRDYMAKNNLMSSGENPDAMMRATTDYMNENGNIYNNEQKFNRGIADQRNAYAAQEQGAYGEIDNSLSAAEREQAQKIADLMNRIRLTNEGYTSDLQSYKDELDAKKMADINAYNMQQQQMSASRARSSGSSSSADKTQKTADTNAVWNELYKQIDSRNAEGFLQQNREAIIENLGSTEYQKMLKYAKDYTYSAAENKQYTQRMNNRRPDTYLGD